MLHVKTAMSARDVSYAVENKIRSALIESKSILRDVNILSDTDFKNKVDVVKQQLYFYKEFKNNALEQTENIYKNNKSIFLINHFTQSNTQRSTHMLEQINQTLTQALKIRIASEIKKMGALKNEQRCK